jgi:catechol 2,3-dioxygenase-like lactoylglutathione lyase family enzyme
MITGLNHINLRAPAALLATLRDFYRDMLGLTVGPRPAFDSEGYWLYAGGQAILHLSTQRGHEPVRGPRPTTTPRSPAPTPRPPLRGCARAAWRSASCAPT